MRRPLACLALVSSALGTVMACAASGAQDSEREARVDPGDAGTTVLGDADPEPDPVDATDEGFGQRPTCSPAGWCETELPADGLHLRDVWAVGDRAFAIATSQTLGYKFLEWDSAGGWKFIDRKLEFNQVTSPMTVWAPDENEVYYSVWNLNGLLGGAFGAIILHGKRPTPPETSWTWTRSQIDCTGFQYLQSRPVISGTSRDDVYTAVCGNVYRLKRSAVSGDAGDDAGSAGESWELDYALEGGGFGMWTDAATADGDVWFAGVRGNANGPTAGMCALLIRRSSDGSTSVVLDGDASSGTCVAKDGVPMVAGQLTQIHAPAKDRLVATTMAVPYDNDLVLVSFSGGEATIATASPAGTMNVALSSPWGVSVDDLWMLATRPGAGNGTMILRAPSVWDGGSFDISTLAINGAPNFDGLVRLRGTSNQNLWAVGDYHAFHKSTP